MGHLCVVCGYPGLDHPPRGAEGGGSLEICPCCGFQSGVDDDDRGIAPVTWRARWVREGMKWWSGGQAAPAGWNAEAQLRAAGFISRCASQRRRRSSPPGGA